MFVVAGVSGRTGTVVADTLLSRGQSVRVLVRDPAKSAAWRARGAEVVVTPLDDAPALARALAGADGLYVLLPEETQLADFDDHRRRLTDAIRRAVEASHVARVVLLSGAAAVVPEGNGLARELHRLERELLATGARVTALRAVGFQENVAAALPVAQRDGIYPNFYPSADMTLPLVATRDVGRLAADCLLEPRADSEIVDVLGPAYTVRQCATALGAALGRPLRIVDVPPLAQVDALLQAGVSRSFAASMVELVACVASGRIVPRGDRAVSGTTRLDDTLQALVPRHAA